MLLCKIHFGFTFAKFFFGICSGFFGFFIFVEGLCHPARSFANISLFHLFFCLSNSFILFVSFHHFSSIFCGHIQFFCSISSSFSSFCKIIVLQSFFRIFLIFYSLIRCFFSIAHCVFSCFFCFCHRFLYIFCKIFCDIF